MTEPFEGPRDLPLVRRLDTRVALDAVRARCSVGAGLGGKGLSLPGECPICNDKMARAHFDASSSMSMRTSVLRFARTP